MGCFETVGSAAVFALIRTAILIDHADREKITGHSKPENGRKFILRTKAWNHWLLSQQPSVCEQDAGRDSSQKNVLGYPSFSFRKSDN